MTMTPSSPIPSLVALLVAALMTAGCADRPASAACVADTAPSPSVAAVPSPSPKVPGTGGTTAPAAPPAAMVTPSQATDGSRDHDRAATTATATGLRVKRLVLAEGVDAREPTVPRDTFKAGELEKVYAFVEVENPERLPGEIVVSFESPDGPAIGNVRLEVGASPRWRTWAFSRAIDRQGEWTAVVRDGEGRVLAREPFAVTS